MWSILEKKDYKNVLEYLEKNSPFAAPLIGNVLSSGFSYKPTAMRSGIYYAHKSIENKILGVIAGFNDGNVMVHTNSEQAGEGVLKIIANLPFHSVWGLGSILPSNDVLSNIADIKLDKRKLDMMVMSKKTLSELDSSLPPDMELTRIDKRFLLPSSVAFIKICLWEGFGFKSNAWDIRKRIKERTNLEPYWFLSHNGLFVAQAHVQAMTRSHGYIGGVCTPRDSRGKGYSKIIMRMVCDYIKKAGRIPSLAVSSSNIIAHNLYSTMGFESIGSIQVYMKEREFKGDENE